VPATSRMAACPVFWNVTSCRPPLAAESSESCTEALGALEVMSTCTVPAARSASWAAPRRADADAGTAAAGELVLAEADGLAVAAAVGDDEVLEPQPASMARPASADVSVIVLDRAHLCGLMGD
jgi:hypothetical protein